MDDPLMFELRPLAQLRYSPLFNDTKLAKYYSDMLQVSKLVVLVQLLSGQDTWHGAGILNLERIPADSLSSYI